MESKGYITMKKTIKQRLTAYFLAKGCVEIASKNKYTMFLAPIITEKDKLHSKYYFVGNNGAVRFNVDSKNAAESISVTEKYKALLLQWEEGK